MDDGHWTRQILEGSIERDRLGRELTPEAKERAVDFAQSVFKGSTNVGQATEAGIKHVTAGILKDK